MKYAQIDSKRLLLPINHSKSRCENGENVRLARSIAKFGIISPLCVKPLSDGSRFEIVSGKRRFCASRLIGMRKIPCMVLEKGDKPSMISLTCDIFSDTDPFELADKLKEELVKNGCSAEKFSEQLGLEVSEFVELLTPTCMSELERRIARENLLSKKEIRKISSLPTREARLSALIASKKSTSQPKIRTAKNTNRSNARRRVALGGLGFFENTLKRSVEILESAGFNTQKEVDEKSDEVKYTVKIRK